MRFSRTLTVRAAAGPPLGADTRAVLIRSGVPAEIVDAVSPPSAHNGHFCREGEPVMSELEVSQDGAVLTVLFNRPEARNAMTFAMYEGLEAACARADEDDAVRVLVLRGAGGRAFVAGWRWPPPATCGWRRRRPGSASRSPAPWATACR